jgi:hypothetical protein
VHVTIFESNESDLRILLGGGGSLAAFQVSFREFSVAEAKRQAWDETLIVPSWGMFICSEGIQCLSRRGAIGIAAIKLEKPTLEMDSNGRVVGMTFDDEGNPTGSDPKLIPPGWSEVLSTAGHTVSKQAVDLPADVLMQNPNAKGPSKSPDWLGDVAGRVADRVVAAVCADAGVPLEHALVPPDAPAHRYVVGQGVIPVVSPTVVDGVEGAGVADEGAGRGEEGEVEEEGVDSSELGTARGKDSARRRSSILDWVRGKTSARGTGSEPGTARGKDSARGKGSEPGTARGKDSARGKGSEPGTARGKDSARGKGSEPGTARGKDSARGEGSEPGKSMEKVSESGGMQSRKDAKFSHGVSARDATAWMRRDANVIELGRQGRDGFLFCEAMLSLLYGRLHPDEGEIENGTVMQVKFDRFLTTYSDSRDICASNSVYFDGSLALNVEEIHDRARNYYDNGSSGTRV